MLKDTLEAATSQLVGKTRRAYAGITTLRRHATEIDAIVQRIYRETRDLESTPAVLVALGGYGRKHQCQFSDVDLLVVFEGRIGKTEERFLSAILHPLWDLGLNVGHQVRELADFDSPETDNLEYLVALLEARFIDGDANVFRQFRDACLKDDSTWRVPMREAVLTLTRQRHAQFNRTVFHLEPDIKDAPGGLRDATAIHLLRRMEKGWSDRAYIDRLLTTLGPPGLASPIFINPASGKKPRAWASDRFRQLAEHLAERYPAMSVLVHDHHPFDPPAGWPSSDSIRTVSGASLVELAAVIERCSLYVGNDSGPMHLAAAVGTPVIGVFTCTTARRSGPPRGRHVLIETSVACGGSYHKRCPQRGPRHLACLQDVSAAEACAGLDRLIASAPAIVRRKVA